MRKRKQSNPFYLLLILAGCAFAITACAYGVMTVRQLAQVRTARWKTAESSAGSQKFDQLVDQHGVRLLGIELALLGIGTAGAIAYDQYLDGKEVTSLSDNNESRTEEYE